MGDGWVVPLFIIDIAKIQTVLKPDKELIRVRYIPIGGNACQFGCETLLKSRGRGACQNKRTVRVIHIGSGRTGSNNTIAGIGIAVIMLMANGGKRIGMVARIRANHRCCPLAKFKIRSITKAISQTRIAGKSHQFGTAQFYRAVTTWGGWQNGSSKQV